MAYKVKELADIAGVSVRTLHHYDKIGLLKPEFVSQVGYRLYGQESLERLQQILFFKELDFTLKEIKDILKDNNFDRKKTMKQHKLLLMQKKQRLEKIIATVDKTIMSIEKGNTMSAKDTFSGFDISDIEQHKNKYKDEVIARWGKTSAYRESAKKTAKYNAQDWQKIQEGFDKIYKVIIDNMAKGAQIPEVQKAVAELQQQFTKYFYNCTPEIFRNLGEMYITDPRFTQFYENMAPGLASFLKDAICIYCDNLE